MRSSIHPRRGARLAGLAAAVLIGATGWGACANAQDGWEADRPNMAQSGNFSVLQIATTDPDRLYADWAQPTAGVNVTNSTEMTHNQPIVTFIVFKGCRADASGNCNVTVDYETTAPGGKVYDTSRRAQVWVGLPAPDLSLQLSATGYGLRVEDKDPLGPYRIRAAVTDHVAGVTLRTEQTLVAK